MFVPVRRMLSAVRTTASLNTCVVVVSTLPPRSTRLCSRTTVLELVSSDAAFTVDPRVIVLVLRSSTFPRRGFSPTAPVIEILPDPVEILRFLVPSIVLPKEIVPLFVVDNVVAFPSVAAPV